MEDKLREIWEAIEQLKEHVHDLEADLENHLELTGEGDFIEDPEEGHTPRSRPPDGWQTANTMPGFYRRK